MSAARRFIVSGRVQGVGFRYFVKQEARLEGLRGWVRNLPDGRVEAVVEGDEAALDRLAGALRRGPGSARVTRVLAEPITCSGLARDFEIRE
jgi:acylphosphatase